jgi:SDR family mycofactocin-dependent oxidoreductase
MPQSEESRVALVTGAARGIGAATVRRLVTAGYAVTAVDCCSGDDVPPGVGYRLASRADLDEISALAPDHVLTLVADVRDRGSMEAAVRSTLDRFARLDAVVAAAGVIGGGLLQWETPEEHLHAQLEVNVHGVWNIAAAALPAMLSGPKPGGCRFVAVASTAGEHGLHRLTAYAAAKHAVIGIVRGLAADLAGTGVTAVAVAPGSTDTAMLAAPAELYSVAAADLAAHQHVQRLLTPDEVAATIAHCCSLEGAALNGSVVRTDGGFRG